VDDDQPLAQRRTRREHRRLPKRYHDRDIPSESLAILTPPCSQAISQAAIESSGPPSQQSPDYAPLARQIPKSTRNAFGLFLQQYYSTRFPDHDPSEKVLSKDLVDKFLYLPSTSPSPYYPYPNQPSLLLGEWYWNDGETKTQSSFQKLLKIVGHPDFHPEDVAGKNWRPIDARLGGERCEGSNEEDGWEDEQKYERLGGSVPQGKMERTGFRSLPSFTPMG
jgi:hypothetical protein